MAGFMQNFPILAIITLFIGAFLVGLTGKRVVARNAVVTLAMTIPMLLMLALIKPVLIDGQVITYWMGNWEPVAGWAIGIGLEVDALSLLFGLVVTVTVFVTGLYSFSFTRESERKDNFSTLFLMLSGSSLGLVLSGDLFNIFVMIEIMTFTSVALTAFRNRRRGALEAAMKYMVVGSVSSACLLIGIAILYSQLHTLNLAQIASMIPGRMNSVMAIAFAFLFTGFGAKAFAFPFHPLEADAQTVAPTTVSVMMSGVLTKCGVYGIIRLCYGLFQNMDTPFVQMLVTGFGVLSMFICVTMAFNQHDFKRLLAFHSISQVGYVITAVGLGSALGMSGALYHAMNHTLFKGLLFLTAGAVLFRTDTVDLDRLGGLARRMPVTCGMFLIGAASISGLPPFNGFASKWMIYQAAFEHGASTGNFFYVFACIAALVTSVLTLASFVKVGQSVFFGQLPAEFENVQEAPLLMRIPMGILAALCVLTGLFPDLVQKYLLTPATNAAMNAAAYIDVMLGEGVAAANGVRAVENVSIANIGCWQPLSWLLLLLAVSCGIAVTAIAGSGKKLQGRAYTIADENPDPKYESFFGGEMSAYSHVGGSDLFWGFKHSWRKYFRYMQDWHSGVVNDYTFYAVAALAISLLLCVIFL